MPRISKSSLFERMECPFAWHCNRDLHMPGKDSVGMIIGTSFHETQAWFQQEKMAMQLHSLAECKKKCADVFDTKVREGWEAKSLEASRDQVKDGRDQAVGLVEAFYEYAVPLKPVAVEQEFSITLPGLSDWYIYGFIDLIMQTDDGLHCVVDYKTAGSSPYRDDPKDPKGTEERRINYVTEALWNPEAACYALAYRVLFGKDEKEFVYFHAVKTKVPKIVPVRFKVGDAQINWFVKLAVDYIRGIMTGLHERRTGGFGCSPKGCPYWDFCHGIDDKKHLKGKIEVV